MSRSKLENLQLMTRQGKFYWGQEEKIKIFFTKEFGHEDIF